MNNVPCTMLCRGHFMTKKLEKTEHLRCLHQAAAVVA